VTELGTWRPFQGLLKNGGEGGDKEFVFPYNLKLAVFIGLNALPISKP